ncbi:MAG: glycosidase, partial [Chitinophagaceae bacterium]
MMSEYFNKRSEHITNSHKELLSRINVEKESTNGIYNRFENPVLTANHAPIEWRFDLDEKNNPFLLERFGINAVFNCGAIKFNNKYVLAARVEGKDRKSFFAIAESENGIDNFIFWKYPIVMPPSKEPETNLYDMRLVLHEDGWI